MRKSLHGSDVLSCTTLKVYCEPCMGSEALANNITSCMTAKLYSARWLMCISVFSLNEMAMFLIACCFRNDASLVANLDGWLISNYWCCPHNKLVPWVLQQWLLAQLTQQSTWSHSKSSVVEVSSAAQAPLVQACCPLHTSTWLSMLLHTWQPAVTPPEAATSTPSIKSARATIIR